MYELESLKARKLESSLPKLLFQTWFQVLFIYFLIFCVTLMILLISISFPIPFCSLHLSFHSFILSFYRTLYNLYLNPNLLKILSNYIYTIPKVITLHIYILTSCLIFFSHFQFSYILSCCAQTDPTIFVISYYHFDCKHCIMPSYCAVLYLAIINFIGSSFKLLCNSALLCHCRSFINLSFVVTFLV